MDRIPRWLVASCLGLILGSAQAAPPQRNLIVEMRVSEEQSETQRDIHGAVVVTSRAGRADAGSSVAVQASSSQQTLGATQRVLVLNGGRATLQSVQGLLVDAAELWWTPWGPGATLRSQWVELVNGVEVRPQWPGGAAPVTVEIAAQRSGPGGPAAQGMPASRGTLSAQWTVMTMVQAPLGEWLSVAQVAGRQSVVASSGFGASTSTRQRILQVRVSLP